MAIILAILIMMTVYCFKFSDDFDKEDLQKVAAFLVVVMIIVVVFMALSS